MVAKVRQMSGEINRFSLLRIFKFKKLYSLPSLREILTRNLQRNFNSCMFGFGKS